jgi:hypothetical protein
MAQPIEIAYYNCFILAGGVRWGDWHVEEARIRGGYNETSVDFGVKAYTTDEEYGPRRRGNAMMYSGIYNSKTKVNKTNEFPIGSAITRAVDIANGNIQKLHAEDTNINIFQENKVSRALIDKDAIYTAEGQALTTAGAKVIGQVIPYLGKYGISKNPESFAFHGGRKYFADKNRGVICRLTRDGVTPISMYGMKDFFRDNLALVASEPNFIGGTTGSGTNRIFGMYDEKHDQYIVSLQNSNISVGKKTDEYGVIQTDTGFATLGFSEGSKGWVSLYSYKPSFGLSLTNHFYTFSNRYIWRHYDPEAEYNRFYGWTSKDPSYVKIIMNDAPGSIKTFHTLSYEGTEGWEMETGRAENVFKQDALNPRQFEQAYKIPKKGVTIIDETGAAKDIGFKLKESKYYRELIQDEPFAVADYTADFNRNIFNTTSGIKGYHAEFEIQYYEANQLAREQKAELFGISNEINISSK